MALDKFVLILVCVMGAAAATVWIATLIFASVQMPLIGVAALIPVALIVYVVWRVIADRIGNTEEDHYDNIDK